MAESEDAAGEFTPIPGHKTKFRIIKEGTGPGIVEASNNVTGIKCFLFFKHM